MIPEKLIAKGKYWQRALSLVQGCTPVSESCQNCWLAAMEYRFDKCPGLLQVPEGLRIPRFNGNIIFREDRLDIPRRTKKSQTFAIWSDLFHEKVSDEFIIKTFGVIYENPKHTYLICTKRIERTSRFFTKDIRLQQLGQTHKLFSGTTCETQQRADERIPYLLQVPGKRFLSLEPLLSDINLYQYLWTASGERANDIHQIIVGAESGSHRRPCKIEWIRSIVQQCKEAGIPVFVKQIHINGKVVKDINKFPEDIRIRKLAWRQGMEKYLCGEIVATNMPK